MSYILGISGPRYVGYDLPTMNQDQHMEVTRLLRSSYGAIEPVMDGDMVHLTKAEIDTSFHSLLGIVSRPGNVRLIFRDDLKCASELDQMIRGFQGCGKE